MDYGYLGIHTIKLFIVLNDKEHFKFFLFQKVV